MSTTGNLARVRLVLGSLIRAFGMAGTSGAGLNSGGFCWAPAGRSAIVRAATAIHNAKRGSHRNMVIPRYAILLCATVPAADVRRRCGSQQLYVMRRSLSPFRDGSAGSDRSSQGAGVKIHPVVVEQPTKFIKR